MMMDRADLALSFLAVSELCSFTNYTSSLAFSGDNLRDSIHQRFVEKKADAAINRPMEKLLVEAHAAKMAILENLGPVHEIAYEKLRSTLVAIAEQEKTTQGFWRFLNWGKRKSPAEFALKLLENGFVRVQKRLTDSSYDEEALQQAGHEFKAVLQAVELRVLKRYGHTLETRKILDELAQVAGSLMYPRRANVRLAADFAKLIDDTVETMADKADGSYAQIKAVIGQVSQAYAPVQRTWFEKMLDFFKFRHRQKTEAQIDADVKALEAKMYDPLKKEYIEKMATATALVRDVRARVEGPGDSVNPKHYLRVVREEFLRDSAQEIGAEMAEETDRESLAAIREASKRIIADEWNGLDQQANGRRDMTPLMIQSKANQGIVRIATMVAALFYAGEALGVDGTMAVAESTLHFVGKIPEMATHVAQDWLAAPTVNPATLMDMVKTSVPTMTDPQVLDAKAALGGSIPLSIFAVLPLVALSLNGNRKILAELRGRRDQAEEKYLLALSNGSDKETRSARADLFYLNLTLYSQNLKTWAMGLQAYPILKLVGWGVQSMASALEWGSIMFSKRKDYRATLWLFRRLGMA
jgi:hypothetical protein